MPSPYFDINISQFLWWTHYYVIQATSFLHATDSLLQSAHNISKLNDGVGASNTISEYNLAERVLKQENSSEEGEYTTAEKKKCEHGRTGQLETIMDSK